MKRAPAFNAEQHLAALHQYLRPLPPEARSAQQSTVFKATVTGEDVRVYEDWQDAGVHGNTIWDGGLALGKFFAWWGLSHALPGKTVLELGAGTGVVGLTLAKLGASVVLTDNIEEVLHLMERNVVANDLAARAEVRHLDWADTTTYLLEGPFDLVVAADVLYDGYGGPILARAFDAHIAPGAKTEGFFAFRKRTEAPLSFFDGMVAMGFCVERLEDKIGRCVGVSHGRCHEWYEGSRFVELPQGGATAAVRDATFVDDSYIQIFRLTRPQDGLPEMPAHGECPCIWRVTATLSKGGLLVRSGQELTSPSLETLLMKGARVAQLGVQGNRLHFRKVAGDGPNRGWVSLAFKGSPLLTRE